MIYHRYVLILSFTLQPPPQAAAATLAARECKMHGSGKIIDFSLLYMSRLEHNSCTFNLNANL
jgi:hypothetical protein